MLRSVSPELSRHVEEVHRVSGIDLRTGIAIGGFETQGDRLTAEAVGVSCDNGVVVDGHMRTSDPQAFRWSGPCRLKASACPPRFHAGQSVRADL